MVVIRSFLKGVLSDVVTWGISCQPNNSGTDKALQKVQINLVIKNDDTIKRQLNRTSNQASFYFVATTDGDSQQHVNDILLMKEIVSLTKLLTEREMDVLKELYHVKSTNKAANNLHISARTFANHRFNITKKLGIPAAEAADFLFECSNVEVFTAMLDEL